jgi:hypothetical protein
MDAQEAKKNTDRELWRKVKDDYYSPSIHVTEGGRIGINVGGMVYVMPVEAWHKLAAHSAQVEAELKFAKMQSRTHSDEAWRKKLTEAEAELVKLQARLRHEWWNNHGCKDFRYGDDGEMQCHGCGGDFLRMPFDELEAHVKKTRWDALCRAGAKLVAEGKDHGLLSGEALGETGPEEK